MSPDPFHSYRVASRARHERSNGRSVVGRYANLPQFNASARPAEAPFAGVVVTFPASRAAIKNSLEVAHRKTTRPHARHQPEYTLNKASHPIPSSFGKAKQLTVITMRRDSGIELPKSPRRQNKQIPDAFAAGLVIIAAFESSAPRPALHPGKPRARHLTPP